MHQKALRTTALILFGCTSLVVQSEAQPLELSLNDVLHETIENNLTLKVNSVGRYLSEQDVKIAESAFDSNLFAGVSTSESEVGSISTSEKQSGYLGLNKKFSTGTSVRVQTSYSGNSGSRYNTDLNQFVGGDDSNNARLYVSVRQPLLKGFGRSANMAQIWKAESQLEVAKLEYKNWVLDIVNTTEKAYWGAAVQDANLELSQTSVEVAESLLKETMQREEVGLATKLDVLQAKANLASKKEVYLNAEKSLQDALDLLYTQMGRLNPEFEDQDVKIANLPEIDQNVPEIAKVWGGALNTDLKTKIQQTQIHSLGFDKAIYKDKLKTNLDLIISGASTGLSPDGFSKSYSEAINKQGHDIGVSLELNVPIGKRSAKASLKKIDAIANRENMRLKLIEQNLFKEVRRQWRALKVSIEKLNAARVTLELEEQAFEQAQTKYSNGLAVFRDVQEAQDSLNRARISELNAWITAIKAEANLSRLDGTQLNRLGIQVNFK